MNRNRPVGSRARGGLGLLSLGALGVVFGDIGTSPLYALRAAFAVPGHELPVNEVNVLGLLSLIVWSLILVICLKYLVFVMRADNDGEGGILALTALVARGPGTASGRRRTLLVVLGLLGAALLYGDGMITPAISVLSAVEGTELVMPGLTNWIVPIAIGILVGLFVLQRRGTATLGSVFGPVMLVWFVVIAALGIGRIITAPGILRAASPHYAIAFFGEHLFVSFLALGAVFLVVTGGEALYADMGHFGRTPIRLAWFVVVLPALLINYFGQGSLLLADHEAVQNPFFHLAPTWSLVPLVVLATLATVVASQALISGAFSLTMQAVQLGYAPRLRIVHTSATTVGQIYVPAVNWVLMAGCIALVVGFRSSDALAAAYGVAVTSTMLITTVLLYVVLRERFAWRAFTAGALCSAFLVMDAAFFGANIIKVRHGGFIPLAVGVAILVAMTTWHTGRRLVAERIPGASLPLPSFLKSLRANHRTPDRVAGTSIFLVSTPGMTPHALLTNFRYNEVLHEQVLVVSIVTAASPYVSQADRAELTDLGDGVVQVLLHYGFMEEPNVPRALTEGAAVSLEVDPERATYFLGSESLIVGARPGMVAWREHLFATMQRNAAPAANYFKLPPGRTITIGTSVEL